jgi:hypothetical protein
VQVKKTYPSQSVFFKGDPHPEHGNNQPFRFIRLIKLPDSYGSGVFGGSLNPANCAPGNLTAADNANVDANDNFFRLEANDVANFINFGWDVGFQGDWTTNFLRGQLFYFQYAPDFASDRSYGHTLRAVATTFTDTTYMHDTHTITGGGTFTNVQVCGGVCGGNFSGNVIARDNTITNTNISGTVTVAASTGTTTISNVRFTGAGRAVITVGTGSTVNATSLCTPSGSTVTGTGTFNYNGTPRTLPYTAPTADCSIVSDGVPNAPTGGSVN